MKLFYLILLISLTFFAAGCAEIELPKPEQLISPWSSMPNIKIGDTKDDILDRWGEPDEINEIGVDELGVAKEEWVYYGRYPGTPVDYQYFSKTKHLYFEGNHLVRQETKEAVSEEKASK